MMLVVELEDMEIISKNKEGVTVVGITFTDLENATYENATLYIYCRAEHLTVDGMATEMRYMDIGVHIHL